MGRRLCDNVWVVVDGERKFLAAGSEPTDAEAALVPNEKAWEDRSALGDPITLDLAGRPEGGEAFIPLRQPPRKGPGSSKAAWASYCADAGFEIPDGYDRDEIVTMVDRLLGAKEA